MSIKTIKKELRLLFSLLLKVLNEIWREYLAECKQGSIMKILKVLKITLISMFVLYLGLHYISNFFFNGQLLEYLKSNLQFINDQTKALKESNVKENPVYNSDNIFFVLKYADNEVTFLDVIGCDLAKKKLRTMVDYINNPEKYKKLNAKKPKGIILYGPSGNGKTLLAKALAREAKINFIATSGSVFIEQWVGLGAKRIRDLFRLARQNKPCIIFIDEFEVVVPNREKIGMDGGNTEYQSTVNQFLSELDGFNEDSTDTVHIIAATNYIENIDPAVIRAGRFNNHIKVSMPNLTERMALLKFYIKKTNTHNVNVDDLASRITNFSAADIEAWVQEAILHAIEANRDYVTQEDFILTFALISKKTY